MSENCDFEMIDSARASARRTGDLCNEMVSLFFLFSSDGFPE